MLPLVARVTLYIVVYHKKSTRDGALDGSPNPTNFFRVDTADLPAATCGSSLGRGIMFSFVFRPRMALAASIPVT